MVHHNAQTWANGPQAGTRLNGQRLQILDDSIGTVADAVTELEDAGFGRAFVRNVLDYGAVGDAVHDDGPAIQAAIDEAAAENGGTVVLPYGVAGIYLTNQQIVVGNKVELVGMTRTTSILAGPGMPSSSALITLGPGGLVFGCRLRNLTVDCGNVAGSTGVFSDGANEQSGCFNVLIANFRQYGVHFDGASIVAFEHMEVLPAAAGATYGIYLRNVAGQNIIQGVTTGVSGPLQAGIRVESSQAEIIAVHPETSPVGVEFANASGAVFGIHGSNTCTTLVRIAVDAPRVILLDLVANGATNLVQDEVRGVTVPADINGQRALTMYNCGEMYLGGMSMTPLGGKLVRWRGTFIGEQSNPDDGILEAGVQDEPNRRYSVRANGTNEWGSGAAGREIALYRRALNSMRLTAGLIMDGLGLTNTLTVSGAPVGNPVGKFPVVNGAGDIIGWVPIYNNFV